MGNNHILIECLLGWWLDRVTIAIVLMMMMRTRMTSTMIKVLDRVDGRKTMREVALCMMMMMMMMMVMRVVKLVMTIMISYFLGYVSALAWMGLGGERTDPEEGEVIVSNDWFWATFILSKYCFGGTFDADTADDNVD